MKHKKNDELTKFQNRVEPEFTVEYLFIEKAKEQIEPINDDQGYQMGCIYIYTRGWYINNNLEDFLEILLDHLIYSLKEYDRFKNKTLDLKDYKFFLIDRDKNATEFAELDEEFYEALTHSLKNLIIVGKNFDLEAFKTHAVFCEWFNKYSNKS